MTCKCGCGQPGTWPVGLSDLSYSQDEEKVVIEYFAGQSCLVRMGLYCLDHERVNIVGNYWDEPQAADRQNYKLIGCCVPCAIEAARAMTRDRSTRFLDRLKRIKSEHTFSDTAERVAGLEDLLFTTPETRVLVGLLISATLARTNAEELLACIEQLHKRHK